MTEKIGSDVWNTFSATSRLLLLPATTVPAAVQAARPPTCATHLRSSTTGCSATPISVAARPVARRRPKGAAIGRSRFLGGATYAQDLPKFRDAPKRVSSRSIAAHPPDFYGLVNGDAIVLLDCSSWRKRPTTVRRAGDVRGDMQLNGWASNSSMTGIHNSPLCADGDNTGTGHDRWDQYPASRGSCSRCWQTGRLDGAGGDIHRTAHWTARG